MRFGSVCSGIEAASAAWHPLGWEAAFLSEIEPFPSAVLAHHYPTVPNLGDMTKYEEWPDANIDVLVGGTPCQSFSVAGLRKGLADPRGNLMLTFGAIAAKYRPRWLVWENVPGVLSSNGGRDFGTFLGMLGELGYGFAYRILDAQYLGVAQRRRRVFVVGYSGDWRRAAAALFEHHSLQGHPAPSREKGKVAPTIPSRSLGGGGLGTDFDCDGGLIAAPHADISPALKARDCKGVSSDGDGDGAILVPMVSHSLRGEGFDASEDGTGRGTPLVPVEVVGTMKACKDSGGWSNSADHAAAGYMVPVAFDTTQITSPGNYSNPQPGDPCHPLASGAHPPAVAFDWYASQSQNLPVTEECPPLKGTMQPAVAFSAGNSKDSRGIGYTEEGTPPLRSGASGTNQVPTMVRGMQVRRLTPVECERLQGFRDGYTNIPWRGKPCAPDGPRYKALGNSMAVPVMRWIGERIAAVDAIQEQVAA